jgi:hypothetical protein
MLRRLTSGFVAVVALSCAVMVGSGVAWSNIVRPAGEAPMTRVDFNRTFADAAAASRAANTPANRERLRDFGWSHLNVRLASK